MKGSVALVSTAARLSDGMMSRSTPRILVPASEVVAEVPLTLPPGRAKLATSPLATGSPAPIMTIGMSLVACLAATAAGVRYATIRSTLRRTSSAARLGSAAASPRARRSSIMQGVALAVAEIAEALAQQSAKRLGIIGIENGNARGGGPDGQRHNRCRQQA